jgi:hypothetical protein
VFRLELAVITHAAVFQLRMSKLSLRIHYLRSDGKTGTDDESL